MLGRSRCRDRTAGLGSVSRPRVDARGWTSWADSGRCWAIIEPPESTLMSHSRLGHETGGATLPSGPAEAAPNRATSSRNGEQNHLGTAGKIKSEWSAASSGFAASFPLGFAAGAILPPALHAIGRFRPCLRPLVADRLRLALRLSPQSETLGACRAETVPHGSVRLLLC